MKPILVAVVAMSMVLSACSVATESAGGNRTSAAEPGQAGTASLAFEPTEAFVVAVMNRLQARSHRFEARFIVVDDDDDGADADDQEFEIPERPTMVGVASEGWTSVQIDTGVGSGAHSVADPSMYEIANSDEMFMYAPAMAGVFDDMPALEDATPLAWASEGWIYVDLERVRDEGGDLGLRDIRASNALDVQPMLGFIDTVEEGPVETIRGVETRSLNIWLDLEAMFAPAEGDGDVDFSAFDVFGDPTLQLFVDADGDVRRIVQGMSPFLQEIDFFDFGAGLSIDFPAEFDDVTDKVIDSASLGSIGAPAPVPTTAPIPTPLPTPAPTPVIESTSFQSIDCVADPSSDQVASETYGQSGSPAVFATLTETESGVDCDRMVIEFQLDPTVREAHSQPLPELTVSSDEVSTQVTFADAISLDVEDYQFLALSSDVLAFAAVGAGRPYLEILHQGHSLAVTTLTEPPRLVIDFAPLEETGRVERPVTGRTTILREPIARAGNAPFRVGDQIRIEGWTLKLANEDRPYYRVITPRESVNEISPDGQAGFVPIPFLTAHGPLERAVDDARYWAEFELELDTSDWIAASHAVLIGSEGSDGFVGTGQLFPVLDENGQTREEFGYLELSPQFLYHVSANSWVEQG